MNCLEHTPGEVDRGQLLVGTAGWSIPREQALHFAGTGQHLPRYAALMRCAEINSTFYRSHRASTYARWAESTPEGFRFSVKVPKAITHEGALAPPRMQIESFLAELAPLGAKLGPLLLQLPPRQEFAMPQAREFMSRLREVLGDRRMVLEPRHPGWFTPAANALLREFQVTRVAADPAPVRVPEAVQEQAGWPYFRLHGSPRVYYSSYDDAFLRGLADRIRLSLDAGDDAWCIFDNTASGAALGDALRLAALLSR